FCATWVTESFAAEPLFLLDLTGAALAVVSTYFCIYSVANATGPPHTCSQIISDLKKDNFNLRLRIFFYEELLQQRYDDSVEVIYKTVSRS
uniref:Centrosomin N-terminal motif 1 domain-containing protein n=1 Tax=Oncorhynchus mykiss TaxID=8022 RepID=A0A8C7W9W0_ONCMY